MKKLLMGAVAFVVASMSLVAGASAGSAPCTNDPTGSVTRLYRAYFLRTPDAGGLAFWVDRCNRSVSSLPDISDAFAGSPEFNLRYGALSNPDFVTLVYHNVLNRDPDAGGLKASVDFLGRGARRGEVMLGFSESPEFQQKIGVVSPAAPAPAPAPRPAPKPAAPTVSQTNARKSAESYLRVSSFSRSGLIDQLEYEGFSQADATYGVDVLNVDWNAQAAKSAASYLRVSSFSHSGLVDQLEYEGFTPAQAEYGVSTTGL